MLEKIEKFAAEKISLTQIEFNALFLLISVSFISIIYNYFDDDKLTNQEKQNLLAVLDSIVENKSNENLFQELKEIEQQKKFEDYNKSKDTLKIDINTASNIQLMKLPNVGEKTAESIINYRNENNGFNSNSDLLKVKGIGPKTFEKIKPFLIPLQGDNKSEKNELKNDTNSETNQEIKIDINTADLKLLITLPGIGEQTALKIIEFRKENKFDSIEDIMKVNGISQKKFEKIKKIIEVR